MVEGQGFREFSGDVMYSKESVVVEEEEESNSEIPLYSFASALHFQQWQR